MPVRVLTGRCEGNSSAGSSEEKGCLGPEDKRKFSTALVVMAKGSNGVFVSVVSDHGDKDEQGIFVSIPIHTYSCSSS